MHHAAPNNMPPMYYYYPQYGTDSDCVHRFSLLIPSLFLLAGYPFAQAPAASFAGANYPYAAMAAQLGYAAYAAGANGSPAGTPLSPMSTDYPSSPIRDDMKSPDAEAAFHAYERQQVQFTNGATNVSLNNIN